MAIGIHVLGQGCGETIILELPDGSTGVVDTYCHVPAKFPAIDFLRGSLGAPRVSFVAATHPHSDHCCGITRLGRELVAEECWAFDAISDQRICDYLYLVTKLGGTDAVDEELELPQGTIALETGLLYDYFVEKARQRPCRARLMHAPERFDICGGEVTVTVLAPGTRSSVEYKHSIGKALSSLTNDGRTISPDWSGGRLRPNLISGSLLLQYGDTRIALMGDTETPLWAEWDEDRLSRETLNTGTVQFLKVGHHGSENAYHPSFYELACDSNTIAVVTPFNRNKSPLPSRRGIDNIRRHTRNIYCTNRLATSESTRYNWRGMSLPAVPRSWASAIANARSEARRRSLERLLALSFSRMARPSPSARIPADWVDDCKGDPELLRLLHPRLRQTSAMIVRQPPQDAFRVSFFFEKDGSEIVNRRYFGVGAGKLARNARPDVSPPR